jgi:hypothetical protein
MSCGPQMVPRSTGSPPLLGVAADVGSAAGDSEDQALIAEDSDGPEDGVAAYVVLLLKLLHRRQWAIAPLAFGDPGSEYVG